MEYIEGWFEDFLSGVNNLWTENSSVMMTFSEKKTNRANNEKLHNFVFWKRYFKTINQTNIVCIDFPCKTSKVFTVKIFEDYQLLCQEGCHLLEKSYLAAKNFNDPFYI